MVMQFRYGGLKRGRRTLVDANDMVVVRTVRRSALQETPLSLDARRAIAAFRTVARFDEAGVEVLRSPGGSKSQRDNARELLKEEQEVQFAGRVLRPSGGRLPVVYTENLFVKFADSVSDRALRSQLRKHGLKVKRKLGIAKNACFVGATGSGTHLGRTVFEIALALLETDSVEFCHPEMVSPIGERQAFPEQWHLRSSVIRGLRVNEHANVEAAWELTRGEGTTIAVIDDGFDLDHEEFRGAGKVVDAWDATRRRPGASSQFRSDRHGTPCAGIACANGTVGASGVAPASRLMPIRLRSGVGSVDEAEAIRWAVDHGADVISCSWGPPDGDWTNPDDPDHQNIVELPDHTRLALTYAVTEGRRGRGCVIVWAAGNGREPVENDGYASAPMVMTVGASNDRGQVAPYSDFGKALWCVFPSDHKLPSFTPGIWTTDRGGGAGFNPGRSRLGDAEGHYTNGFGGTSAACPGAAGISALVISRNPALSWQKVMDVLADTSDKIGGDDGNYDEKGHSPHYGYGRLNARRAVEQALAASAGRSVTHRAVRDVPIRDRRVARLKLNVSDAGTMANLEVEVDIEHTYRGDLVVRLLTPRNRAIAPIVLHDRRGQWRDDIKRVFDKSSTPELAQLEGVEVSGTWTLEVQDRARSDEGRIRRFGLTFDLRV